MKISVNMKQLSRRGRRITPVTFEYEEEKFEKVEDFLKATVRIMYKSFLEKPDGANTTGKILSEEELSDMAELGRITFGFVYGGRNTSLEKAEETALLAYTDGMVRLFVGDEEAGELTDPIFLKDGDEVTFIRLAMLAGRMW